MYKYIIIVQIVVLLSFGCKENNKNPITPAINDTLVTPVGKIVFNVLQYGDTLGRLEVDENKHYIELDNAVHIDSIPFDILAFRFEPVVVNDILGLNPPQAFIFIQAINPDIAYNDFVILSPQAMPSIYKDYYSELQSVPPFYVEMFVCFFDIDNENSGTHKIIIRQLSSVNSQYFKNDTLTIDAGKNTVVLDSALVLKDITVSAQQDDMVEYTVFGRYENRPSRIFLLTQYPGTGYDYYHSGVYWEDRRQWIVYPENETISYIYTFWPVINTNYTNHFWENNYCRF